MSSNKHLQVALLLPFLISGGMAFGALIGMNSVSNAITQEGSPGDVAGAAGALMLVICAVVGFVMAILTVIVAQALHRRIFNRIVLRFGLSIGGGGIIGALGANSEGMSTIVVWFILLGLPILLSWPWYVTAVSDVETPLQ